MKVRPLSKFGQGPFEFDEVTPKKLLQKALSLWESSIVIVVVVSTSQTRLTSNDKQKKCL